MNIVYLNGKFVPKEEASISPMDRGFLFGDGIYEVIPSYAGKYVGLEPHLARMKLGLAAIEINHSWSVEEFRSLCDELIARNSVGSNGQYEARNLGLYVQVTRGVDEKRYHAYSNNMTPTVFLHCFEIPAAPIADKAKSKKFKVDIGDDLRWQRCDIKTTSLLGNVMHYQQGIASGYDETILFDQKGLLTEASASNVFIVENGKVSTPKLDEHKLAGVTRKMLIDILNEHSDLQVEECDINKDRVLNADEVWLTSATKQIAPVVNIAGQDINNGEIGDTWLKAQQLFSQYQFDAFV